MRFQFNLQTHTLKVVHCDHSLVLSEAAQFCTLGGLGFALDYSEPPEHWIIFSVYRERVKVVYKNAGTYYRREILRPHSGIIEVEFSEWDRIEKPNISN